MGMEWCNGPARTDTVVLRGQWHYATCSCGRHDTRVIHDHFNRVWMAQAHIRADVK